MKQRERSENGQIGEYDGEQNGGVRSGSKEQDRHERTGERCDEPPQAACGVLALRDSPTCDYGRQQAQHKTRKDDPH